MKVSREMIDKRRQKVLNYLRENANGNVTQMAIDLGVSKITIRRDLNSLESQGIITRFFGGARIQENSNIYASLSESLSLQKSILALAKAAANMLSDGDTVFMNSSSSILNIYQFLGIKSIIFVTNNGNSLNTPRSSNVELVLTGGEVYGNKNSLVGEYALNAISKVKCNKCLIGVAGISVDGGLTSSILPETAINKAMIANSTGHKIVVADSSKIGVDQNFFSGQIDSITHLITNSDANPKEIQRIRDVGVEVILV